MDFSSRYELRFDYLFFYVSVSLGGYLSQTLFSSNWDGNYLFNNWADTACTCWTSVSDSRYCWMDIRLDFYKFHWKFIKSESVENQLKAGRSAGLLIGSLLAPMVDRTDKLSHMFLLFISAAVCGASLGIIPILTDLWIMILVISVTGIMLGYIDAAIQDWRSITTWSSWESLNKLKTDWTPGRS